MVSEYGVHYHQYTLSICLLRQVSKVGGDEQESFPASSAMRSMKPRQRSMGALRISDSGHLAEDEEEDGDGGSDLDKDSATCTSDDG